MKDLKKNRDVFQRTWNEISPAQNLVRLEECWVFFQNWKIVLLVYTCTQNESESITRHQCD